jgi:hypothetical protein
MGCSTCFSNYPNRHGFGFSDVQTLTRRSSVGLEDLIYCLNVCWQCHKNRDIIGVCHYRSFCGAMSKSDVRKILFQEIEHVVQNQGEEEEDDDRTALSDGT